MARRPSGLAPDRGGWAGLPSVDDGGHGREAYIRTYGPTTADRVQYYLGEGLSAGRKALRGSLDDELSDRIIAFNIKDKDLLVHATMSTSWPRPRSRPPSACWGLSTLG